MKRFFIFFLLIFSQASLFSQGNQTYNLQQCVKIAVENNPDIRNTAVQISARAAELTNAFGNYLPTITANSSYRRQLNNVQVYIVDGRIVNSADAYSMNANASWSIFDGFNREASYTRAKKNLESAELNTAQIERDITLQVYRNYITVIRNYQVVETRKQNLELGKKELEQIQAQFEAGIIPIGNVYSQEAELGQREIDLINAENDYNSSKANLMLTMGLNPLDDAQFDVSSLPNRVSEFQINEFKQSIGTMNGALARALKNRFDYKAAETQLAVAESGIKIAQSNYFPQLNANGGWNWANNELNNFSTLGTYSVGFSLFVPIFTNFSVNNQVQNARVNLEQREIDYFRLEQSIKSDIRNVFLNLEAGEKQVEISEKSLKASQQNYDSVLERFKVGTANITDLSIANNQLINAKINLINAVYSYYLAQKEILYTIGEL